MDTDKSGELSHVEVKKTRLETHLPTFMAHPRSTASFPACERQYFSSAVCTDMENVSV